MFRAFFLSAVKRLMKEAAELKDPTDHYHAQPLEVCFPMCLQEHVMRLCSICYKGRAVDRKIVMHCLGKRIVSWIENWLSSLTQMTGQGMCHSELCHFVVRSQDFCCEMCGTSMKTALLPLTSGSGSSQADKEAKELARQISFKSEAQPSSTAPGQERAPSVPTNTSLSPRQRRAQQHSQRWAPASTDFNRVQQPRANPNHTGSTVLIVLLTFALAALIFRRICLANEYIFEL
uniref:Ubiquitin conjugating enzyme E2 J1 n=1 Tax=Pavo cristatus TaxID=9049 RepID=A0A8C9L1V2_PAVCR